MEESASSSVGQLRHHIFCELHGTALEFGIVLETAAAEQRAALACRHFGGVQTAGIESADGHIGTRRQIDDPRFGVERLPLNIEEPRRDQDQSTLARQLRPYGG